MSFQPEHEIYRRRFSRNLGLGLTLVSFVAVVFALTVAKVTNELPPPAAAQISGADQ